MSFFRMLAGCLDKVDPHDDQCDQESEAEKASAEWESAGLVEEAAALNDPEKLGAVEDMPEHLGAKTEIAAIRDGATGTH